jgi:hypothetical protein
MEHDKTGVKFKLKIPTGAHVRIILHRPYGITDLCKDKY